MILYSEPSEGFLQASSIITIWVNITTSSTFLVDLVSWCRAQVYISGTWLWAGTPPGDLCPSSLHYWGASDLADLRHGCHSLPQPRRPPVVDSAKILLTPFKALCLVGPFVPSLNITVYDDDNNILMIIACLWLLPSCRLNCNWAHQWFVDAIIFIYFLRGESLQSSSMAPKGMKMLHVYTFLLPYGPS